MKRDCSSSGGGIPREGNDCVRRMSVLKDVVLLRKCDMFVVCTFTASIDVKEFFSVIGGGESDCDGREGSKSSTETFFSECVVEGTIDKS